MTQTNNLDVNKKLSKLKQIAIDIVSGIESVIKNRDIINQRLDEGRRLGFSDIEIGDAIRRESKGKLSDRTVRYYLPDTAKHIKHASEHKQPAMLPVQQVNRRLVVPEEPTIPPPPEVHQEAEIIPSPISITIGAPGESLPISKTIEVVFDPAPIDRDRTQVFILEIDIVTKKVRTYKTVGRRTIGR